MKIVTKCPIRISLVGGSTDSPRFIEKYNRGSVISFTPNLFTYSSVFQDVNGFNNFDKKYILSYSKSEQSHKASDIDNGLLRESLLSLPTPPCKISLDSDIFSSGSGLAVSSSFTVGVVTALNVFKENVLQVSEICKQAFNIEKKINPYNGYQDTYGVAFGGFKRLDFFKDNTFSIKYLDPWIFNDFDFYLVYTGVKRSSTNILKTIDIDKSFPLLREVDVFEKAITSRDKFSFLNVINESWEVKKQTSSSILNNSELTELDNMFSKDPNIGAHKLCGAGGGGYFLVIIDKNKGFNFKNPNPWIKINLDTKGVSTLKI